MSRFRIGLIAQGGAKWMGGQEYIRNLAAALHTSEAAQSGQIEVILLSGAPLEASFRQQMQSLTAEIRDGILCGPDPLPKRIRYFVQRRILRHTNGRFADAVRSLRLDFLYPFTYDNVYNVDFRFPIARDLRGTRWAGWIPDFQHHYMPQLFDRAEIAKRARGISALAQEADTIVLSSVAAAGDFKKLCAASTAQLRILRFHTSPNDSWFTGDPAAIRTRYHLPERYFLVSNQFWAHKNHLLIFEALKQLAENSARPHVVCTGHPYDFRNKDYFNVILQKIHEFGIAPQVSLLGLISRAEQIQLMRGALAVIQPSLFEGWSTVVEDARALGRPVILSDLTVHQEQNPPGAQYFAASDVRSLVRELDKAWQNLAVGPDPERESVARREGIVARREMAAQFLEIAGAN